MLSQCCLRPTLFDPSPVVKHIFVIRHVALRFASFNMSTIFDSITESPEVLGKALGSYLHTTKPANVADLASTTIELEHTTEDQDLVALRNWLQTAPSSLLRLGNISLEQAETLEVKLRGEGHKFRHVTVTPPAACSLLLHLGTTGATPIKLRCSEWRRRFIIPPPRG